LRKTLTQCAARCTLLTLYLLLPVMPLLASMVLMRWKFVRHYAKSLHKMRVHLAAIGSGPLQRYLDDVAGRARQIPDNIEGSCIQCGNCCMQRQCAFIEPAADNKFQCGIYNSFWRRFSNCSSFPLNQYDIERYECPSYYAAPQQMTEVVAGEEFRLRPIPLRFVRNPYEVRSTK
jgi:hypothetical protein